MEEIFKDVSGLENYYQVSNEGRLRSKKTGRIYNLSKPKDGYPRTRICLDGVKLSVNIHRLVAVAFVPNPEGKKYVNHIDGDKTNNHATNLEWCTPSENNNHALANGLYKNKKNIIHNPTGRTFKTIQEVADFLKMKRSTVSCKLSGHRTNNLNINYI